MYPEFTSREKGSRNERFIIWERKKEKELREGGASVLLEAASQDVIKTIEPERDLWGYTGAVLGKREKGSGDARGNTRGCSEGAQEGRTT